VEHVLVKQTKINHFDFHENYQQMTEWKYYSVIYRADNNDYQSVSCKSD